MRYYRDLRLGPGKGLIPQDFTRTLCCGSRVLLQGYMQLVGQRCEHSLAQPTAYPLNCGLAADRDPEACCRDRNL